MSFMEWVEVIVWDYMWGTPMVVIVLAIGAYITYKSGFFQFRYLGYSLKEAMNKVFEKDSSGAGIVSSFQALSVAIGTTVGVGNIGGVATAIAVGGPGAVFWMWVAGILGQIVKTAEIALAVHYRTKNPDDTTYGGPNYYMQKGIGEEKNKKVLYKVLSLLFAFGFLIGFFINIQTYTVAEAIGNTFDISMVTVGVAFTVVLYLMIAGGLPSLGKIAAVLVPFMCIFYIAGGLFIILKNIGQLPHSFALIFGSAFTGSAAFGGFIGASFSQAIKIGMARSVFSNEAGWGTSPMIYASTRTDHPMKQAILGIFEVFIDTIVICTITALLIIITGQWSSGLDGATLTLSAFEIGLGRFGRIILAVGIFLFGVTTSSGLFVQMEVIVRYLIGDNPKKDLILKLYKWLYPIPQLALVLIAVYYEYPGTLVWVFSDASTALPIFANLVALLILAPRFIELLNDYKARYMGIGKVDPDFKPFYQDRIKNVKNINVTGNSKNMEV